MSILTSKSGKPRLTLTLDQRFIGLCGFSIIMILLSIPLAVSMGSANIHAEQIYQIIIAHLSGTKEDIAVPLGIQNIIWELRIPRTLMACITGAGLAIAGLCLQSITRNTLADPHLLGISSGAVLGAVIVTMHTGEVFGSLTLPIASFLGSLLATTVIAVVSQSRSMYSATHLLMCGVALSFVLMSVANFALFLGDNRSGHQVIFWMLGGLGLARWDFLLIPLLVLTACFIFLRLYTRYINAMLIGDETAASLGIRVKRLRMQLFLASALLTSVLVAHTGAIGFVGLMIPHIGRYFVGGDIRRLLPISAVFGGLFLIWVDVLSRTILAPQDLPIGIITGFLGGLFFIALLIRGMR
ncbi:Hemin transport system permease protein HmuU [BD1-7 clade bacterium]|uniref:Hemin transport system permease protein HmuU n=1 Tax=BD1-7 clade bacterium TaxID=2029982 RepID=A0A5S9QAI5_9GAMM|nr:Hemin transport system permease protein HmuU [BD1-7 clade bacterium]CAA0114827.1 Hemin transport system permease protein HmuU [BD1-7 clade bacterium]